MKPFHIVCLITGGIAVPCLLFSACATIGIGGSSHVTLMTLDPGHFHAALVQKTMYPQVNPRVYVYAPEGQDVLDHLARIDGYNKRKDNPTKWETSVYTRDNYFEKLIEDKPGNVVVISGNNAKKAQYISQCVGAGLNVLADKPMAITAADFKSLCASFDTAARNRVLLYDIMTERYEVTTMLQRELSMMPALFGTLESGRQGSPSVTKESVHHFCKEVSGAPLKRPAWFFDVAQQGDGIADVTTHLVDLIQWECFPNKIIDWHHDVTVIGARRWPTKLSQEQFKKVTQLAEFPECLKKDVDKDGMLNVYANGEIHYVLRGVHAKVSVRWDFEAPKGASDTHSSVMKGTKANVIILQGAEQGYKPALYIEKANKTTDADLRAAAKDAVGELETRYPGITLEQKGELLQVVIPPSYNVGHEAHFAQVTERYLKYLGEGALPAWEVPNMLAKYYTTTTAYEMSQK